MFKLRFTFLPRRYFSTQRSYPLTVFFGSQTGNAMGFAHDLGKAAKKRKFEANVVDLSEFTPQHLDNNGMVVLVTACFGQGEPTDNARKFYNWLMAPEREAESDFFKRVRYAVFGLGQSKLYPERYQKVSIEFDERLKALQAQQMLPRGIGDDAGDLEGDFEAWQEDFWPVMEKLAAEAPAAAPAAEAAAAAPPQPTAAPAAPSAAEVKQAPCVSTAHSVYTISNPYFAPVTSIRELHTLHSPRSCVHLELDLTGTDISYTTGDYVAVFPRNSTTLIRSLCHHLDLNPIEKVAVPPPVLSTHAQFFPTPKATYLEQVLEYCDILSAPKRTFLRGLVEFASGEDKKKLKFLASSFPMAAQDYQSWVVGDIRSVLDVLKAFPSVQDAKMTSEQLLDLLSPLAPRYYSISSSSEAHPTSVHFAVSVVNFVTPTGRRHQGPATRFLRRLQHNAKVPCFVKQSLFRLPAEPEVPVIMIGGGTGVGPFRAFVQERALQRAQGKKVGPTVLYCGFNRRTEDYLYEKEFEQWERDGILTLRPAFSHEHEWRYFVQHRMVEDEDADLIWDLIHNKGAHVYICGSAVRLGNGGRQALMHIFQRKGMAEKDAEEYLRNMEQKGHFQMDVY